jgi:hypothetical protein
MYTNVSYLHNGIVYNCNISVVYIWLFIISFLTFVISIIVIIKTHGNKKKHAYAKFDAIVNIALINALLCLIVIVALFQ